MANPRGKTYHYGAHNPVAEPGRMRFVYKDEPRRVGPPAARPEDGRSRPSPTTGSAAAVRGAPGAVADTVGRHPLLSVAAALGCGLVAAALCPWRGGR
jgi:hypothetical protein